MRCPAWPIGGLAADQSLSRPRLFEMSWVSAQANSRMHSRMHSRIHFRRERLHKSAGADGIRPRPITLSEARSRLDQRRFSRPNTHFFSIFQNLQENHLLASKFGKFLPKSRKFLKKILTFFRKFYKFLQKKKICQNFDIFW